MPAAVAYDQAFAVYEQLPTDQRWRVFWYQTGIYFAYFNTARYRDVLDLANYVLDITPEDAIQDLGLAGVPIRCWAIGMQPSAILGLPWSGTPIGG